MFPGMSNRIQNDIQQLYLDKILKGDRSRLKKVKVNVEAPTNRKHSVFVGGSVLADLMKDHSNFWMTRSDYEELGVERALAKCRI